MLCIMTYARIAHRKNTEPTILKEVPQVEMVSSTLMKERRFQLSKTPLITKKTKNSHSNL